MKIEELLKEIEKGNVKDGALFHGRGFFYPMIVSDKKLYLLNTMRNGFVLVDSSDIAHFIVNNYEIYPYLLGDEEDGE